MKSGEDRRRAVANAIFADEIGIEYGILGDYRLKSAYQPIFAVDAVTLRPVAVEASTSPHLMSRVLGADEFFTAVPQQQRGLLEAMCRSLHLRNYRNIGVEGLDLFFNHDPGVGDRPDDVRDDVESMTAGLGEIELRPDLLVGEIAVGSPSDDELLVELADAMRQAGIRVAVDDFGTDPSTQARVALLKPDVVKIAGGWFAEICRHAAAERLFRPLVGALQDRGAKVLVEGIGHTHLLRVALDGGADLLQGSLLGRPVPAGAIFDNGSLETEPLLRTGGGKIIPLFG